MALEIRRVDRDSLEGMLPFPELTDNKYSRGKLTAVGGSSAYPGAICLAATAAERMGAGYVEVFCSDEAIPIVRNASESLVVRLWDQIDIASSSLHERVSSRPQACLVGPGFSSDDSQAERRLFEDAMGQCAYPVLIDGGAIGYLASTQGIALSNARPSEASCVITPHFGEAERLAHAANIFIPQEAQNPVKIDDISSDSCISLAKWAHDLASAYKATVALKGPDTFIAKHDCDTVYIMDFGGPALSKAGTGDVLAGMTSSLLAQGMDEQAACVLATSLHALSASLASEVLTEICVCPQDIICFLPEMIRSLIDGSG